MGNKIFLYFVLIISKTTRLRGGIIYTPLSEHIRGFGAVFGSIDNTQFYEVFGTKETHL